MELEKTEKSIDKKYLNVRTESGLGDLTSSSLPDEIHFGPVKLTRLVSLKELQQQEELRLRSSNEPYEFDCSVVCILDAIVQDKTIAEIRISEKIQDPNFRFTSKLEPEMGTALSEALSAVVVKAQKFHHSLAGKKGSAVTNEMRNKKVDEYAANMYQIINGMKEEAGVKSIRATVDLLTKNKVTPPSGKEWNIAAVQDLQKRWKNLGLLSSPDPK